MVNSQYDTTTATTVIPVLRDDGTIYFRYPSKSVADRVCAWSVASLWLLVGGVIVTTLLI